MRTFQFATVRAFSRVASNQCVVRTAVVAARPRNFTLWDSHVTTSVIWGKAPMFPGDWVFLRTCASLPNLPYKEAGNILRFPACARLFLTYFKGSLPAPVLTVFLQFVTQCRKPSKWAGLFIAHRLFPRLCKGGLFKFRISRFGVKWKCESKRFL